mmetsp:Transcript_45728/g.52710  ORF Transcript_45728/g.52710 Transcript_45728/m.52710 type:complete len:369 (-) Transcript_45728:474-1580(-)
MFSLFFAIVQLQLTTLVSEQQFVAVGIQFQEINLRIVINSGNLGIGSQILDADSLQIQQISNGLSNTSLTGTGIGLSIVQSGGNLIRIHILRSASSHDFMRTILNQGQLSGIEDHANAGITEVKLLITRSHPGDFTEVSGFHVSQQQGLRSMSHNKSSLVGFWLGNIQIVERFQGQRRVGSGSLDNNLARGNVDKLEFTLLDTLDQGFEDVNGTAQRSHHQSGAIILPAQCGDTVQVINMFDTILFPSSTGSIVIENVESIKVTEDYTFSARVESGNSKLLHFVVMGVVESLDSVAISVIKDNLAVISGHTDVLSPIEGVRNTGMSQNFLLTGIFEMEAEDAAIKMSGNDAFTVQGTGNGYHITVSGV